MDASLRLAYDLNQRDGKMQELIDKSNSDEKLLEEKEFLEKFNKHLEEKVKDRTKEINDLLKQKDEFITQLGHDLKTPISILLNILPMIQEDSEDPTIKQDCETAIRNVNYIKNLVDETLKIAEISSLNTKYNIKEFNFSNLINNILAENKPLFEMKNIKINNQISSNLIVNADELKIKEVMNNLLSNAVKYSENDGEISLNYKIENNKIIFSVTDSGKGLNDDQLNHIFDEFYKADESRHNLSSSGLGLSICKRIIEKHGEKIWAESRGIGYGATLYFTLKIGGS